MTFPHPSSPQPAGSHSILVLRLSALGDVIHTLPAVVRLRDSGEITWVVEAPYRELVELVAGVRTLPVRMKHWTRDPRAAIDAIRRMRSVDTSVDFQGLIKSSILGWLAGARARFGFDRAAIREKPALLFTNRQMSVDISRHVIDQNLELAEQVGRALARSRSTGAGDRFDGQPRWDAFPTPVSGAEGAIVLLPGAGSPNKLWPADRFRELARRIGPKALVVWGPGERELAEAVGAPMAPPTNLRELAGVLRGADVVIGADTGPLHLAAALGRKVIGLYGPTDPRRNGPYGQLDRCVDRFGSTKSMESISVEDVMQILAKVTAE